MRIGKRLSELLIKDIAEALPQMGLAGMTFKYPDRLTREEAEKLYEAAFKSPELIEAHRATGTRKNDVLGIYQGLVQHFRSDHPADAAGAPAEWPKREPTFPDRNADNPFAHMHPEDAEAVLTWATTRPEYDEQMDGKNPVHKQFTEELLKLREVINRGPAADPNAAPSDAPSAAALDAIKQAESNPAFRNKNDLGHAAATEAVSKAYAAAYPDQTPRAEIGGDAVEMARRGGGSDAPTVEKPIAAGAGAKSPNASALARISEMQKNPAYWNKGDPGHAAATQAMSKAYSEAYDGGGDKGPEGGGAA